MIRTEKLIRKYCNLYVSINGYESGLATINCGVSQRLVLYIFSKVHHFADDNNFLCLCNYQKPEQTSQC